MKSNNFKEMTNIVAIGGGHGLGQLMSALSKVKCNLTGIVTTTDNGGSSGKLRAENSSYIAWGDLRNCLMHLAPEFIGREVFNYRFSESSELKGHSLGNLIFVAMTEIGVGPQDAITMISSFLNVKARLIPMSEDPTHLVATNQKGDIVFGEQEIDLLQMPPKTLDLEPKVSANSLACSAIDEADLIILGPGSFFTSTIPSLLIPEISASLIKSNAKIILIENLTSELSSAAQLSTTDKINWCNKIIGADIITGALCNGAKQKDNNITYFPLNSKDRNLHDKQKLIEALNYML